MKLVAVLFVFAPVLISTQEIQDWENDTRFLQTASLFLPSKTCEQQVIEPLAQLLYPMPFAYISLCDPSTIYFQGCRDPTLIECKEKLDSEDACSTYMYWIDAFVAGGKKFTCSVSFENITDIFLNQGGYDCTLTEVGFNLTQSVIALQSYLSTPTQIVCSDMKGYVEEILTLLDSCNSKAMFNLVKDYFKQVVTYSPCLADSESGIAASSMINTLVLASTVLFYAAILFLF